MGKLDFTFLKRDKFYNTDRITNAINKKSSSNFYNELHDMKIYCTRGKIVDYVLLTLFINGIQYP